jgi:starch synthase (maltosyl-transferring)
MCYSKRASSRIQPGLVSYGDRRDDIVIVVVNLNPYRAREATVWLDLPALGVDGPFVVTDELTGESYWWGRANYVRLDPATRPAHIFTVTPGA